MNRKLRRIILVVTLLGVLLLTGAMAGQPSLAEGRDGLVGEALWERLLGLVQGPWVGQFDSRLYVGMCETLEYSILYGNNGAAVSDAALRICLPAEVDMVSVRTDPVIAPEDQESDPATHCIELSLGALASGGGGSVNVFVQVKPGTPAGAELSCIATMLVEGVERDRSVSGMTLVRAPLIESEILTNGAAMSEGLAITRCTEVIYTLIYTNTGNMGATSMAVTMTLPTGFQFRHAEPAAAMGPGNTVVWTGTDLAVDIDESQTLNVWAFAPQSVHTWPGVEATCSALLVSQLCAASRPEAIVTGTTSTRATIAAGPCSIYLPQVYRYHDAYYWPADDSRSDNPNRVRDHYEYDDIPEVAREMQPNGQPTAHTFHKPWDEDWITFYALPGVSYLIEVYDLRGSTPPASGLPVGWVPRTDPLLKIYEPRIDPLSPLITGTLICESDDVLLSAGDFGARCSFKADTRGWYFVQIRQYDPLFPVNDPWKYPWTLDETDVTNRWKRYYQDNGYSVRIRTLGAMAGPAANRAK